MQTIWLIRHAESKSNAGEATDAPNSIGLSGLGTRQAQRLAERFPAAPDLIVVSKYARTGLTAAPLLERFPDLPMEEWPLHEFTYLAPARYVGTTENDRRLPAQQYWDRCDPNYCDGEGAESFATFMKRVRTWQPMARAAARAVIAVFAHGFVIKAAIWDLLQGSPEVTPEFMRGFYDLHLKFPVKNASVTPLLLDEDAPPEMGTPWLYPYHEEAPESVARTVPSQCSAVPV